MATDTRSERAAPRSTIHQPLPGTMAVALKVHVLPSMAAAAGSLMGPVVGVVPQLVSKAPVASAYVVDCVAAAPSATFTPAVLSTETSPRLSTVLSKALVMRM